MKRQLWAIIDKKTNDITGVVITALHRAEVERIVEEALSNPKNLLRRYPQDFTMLKIAELITGEEGVHIHSALNNELGNGDAIDVNELATKIEIDWHRAAQAEAAEKEEAEAYAKWVEQNHPNQHKAPLTEHKRTWLNKIFGGTENV